jgi:hypothetical protein
LGGEIPRRLGSRGAGLNQAAQYASTLLRPSVPGMGQDLQPGTRLPERVTTTVVKRKGDAARPA